ncbi:hypothetical protein INT47_003653 [Mucor saturninus]|uniref:Uncharacterized protein n=1 Tax=Mucor saturninus TaxID=64648 RepID=A0A8H7R8V5_9FUNG|nr:hypothetical protein INT47_003653 [Mucor saturninus]
MKVVTTLVVGILLSACTAYTTIRGLRPWAPKVLDMCFHHPDQIRANFTNVSTTLDSLVCFYVKYHQQALHDIIGAPLKRINMMTFATVYVLMALEGSRKGFKSSTLLISFPVLGLLANLIGMPIVFLIIWVPLYFHYWESPKKMDLSITMPQVYGILLGILLGYVLPSALISSPYIANNSMLEGDLLCIWQVLPILIVPLFGHIERLFAKMGSSVDGVEQADLKKRLTDVQGKDACERTYLLLGVLNMLVWYGSYLMVAHQGIHLKDSLLLLLNAPGQLPAGLNFTELGQLLGARTILVECIAFIVSFVLWATFQSGLLVGLLVAVATPLMGPGAALAFYSYYREGQIPL